MAKQLGEPAMEGLTLQERHIQLLSFLKDPQAHPHPFITPKDFMWHLGEIPRAEAMHEFRQIAIDFMESGVIRQGYLQGNRRTPDIPIHRLEDFVLNAAVKVQDTKWVIDRSPHAFLYGLPPAVPKEIMEEYHVIMRAIDRLSSKLSPIGQTRSDSIRTDIQSFLSDMLEDHNINRAEPMVFGLVDELIVIFLRYIPEAPDNLIATHIFNFISKRRDYLTMDIDPPKQGAIRKRVEKYRKKLTITSTI